MKKSYILLIIVLVLIAISLRSCSGYATPTNNKKCGSDNDCSGQGRYYKCKYYKGAGNMCSTS